MSCLKVQILVCLLFLLGFVEGTLLVFLFRSDPFSNVAALKLSQNIILVANCVNLKRFYFQRCYEEVDLVFTGKRVFEISEFEQYILVYWNLQAFIRPQKLCFLVLHELGR